MQKYGNKYFENYARLTLIECYDPACESLAVMDRPDLQSKRTDFGVEVTQAITETEGRCNNDIANRFKERGYGYEDIRSEVMLKHIMRENGAKEKERSDYAMYDPKTTFDLIQDRIFDKLIKLNKNYERFARNGLYIFAETPLLNDFDVRVITTFIEKTESEFETIFDIYFINCIDKIYVYLTQERMLEAKPIPTNMLKTLKTKALKLSAE